MLKMLFFRVGRPQPGGLGPDAGSCAVHPVAELGRGCPQHELRRRPHRGAAAGLLSPAHRVSAQHAGGVRAPCQLHPRKGA
jgi:hypothetical protein